MFIQVQLSAEEARAGCGKKIYRMLKSIGYPPAKFAINATGFAGMRPAGESITIEAFKKIKTKRKTKK